MESKIRSPNFALKTYSLQDLPWLSWLVADRNSYPTNIVRVFHVEMTVVYTSFQRWR